MNPEKVHSAIDAIRERAPSGVFAGRKERAH